MLGSQKNRNVKIYTFNLALHMGQTNSQREVLHAVKQSRARIGLLWLLLFSLQRSYVFRAVDSPKNSLPPGLQLPLFSFSFLSPGARFLPSSFSWSPVAGDKREFLFFPFSRALAPTLLLLCLFSFLSP